MPRKAARVDANQTDIVRRLRELGATVLHLHTVGDGCPDLLVGARGENVLVEIKTSTGKLRAMQTTFIEEWRGGDIYVLRTVEDAQMLIEEMGQ